MEKIRIWLSEMDGTKPVEVDSLKSSTTGTASSTRHLTPLDIQTKSFDPGGTFSPAGGTLG